MQRQYDDLTSQFHGFSSPRTSTTLTRPNDPTLADDFEHAASTSPPAPATTNSTSNLRPKGQRSASGKTVRFSDNPASSSSGANQAALEDEADLEAQRLFGNRYRDDPSGGRDDEGLGYGREAAGMTNTQIHAYHEGILSQQDEQLDALGRSIARQRELSMRMGDELDDQVAMLDEADGHVDRHQGRLDRARRRVERVASRAAGEGRQMVAIVVLIIILILLIVLLK